MERTGFGLLLVSVHLRPLVVLTVHPVPRFDGSAGCVRCRGCGGRMVPGRAILAGVITVLRRLPAVAPVGLREGLDCCSATSMLTVVPFSLASWWR